MDSGSGSTIVDFSRSIPPPAPILGECLRATLAEVAANATLASLVHNAPSGGSERDRAAGAAWLEPRFGRPVPQERIIVTNGTQNALFLLFEGLVGQGGLLLAETLTYGVIRALADLAHIRIKGVPIDDDGLIPDAFEQLCQTERPRALYCNPTDQNPTTAIVPQSRRAEIARIARHYGVPIIEDDALGRLHPGAPPPIAALAPDITWYVMGLTKCLAHGLRLAYLVGPSPTAIDGMVGVSRRLSHWFPAPLSAAVATRWIGDGTADRLCAAISDECAGRQRLAADYLADHDVATHPTGLHLWLKLQPLADRSGLVSSLKAMNVLVRPADAFAVDETLAPNAVRLSLSSPFDRNSVERGLQIIAAALETQSRARGER